MRLLSKSTIKALGASVWGKTKNVVTIFITVFQEWWEYFRTRNIFIFKKFKKALYHVSAIITYCGVVFYIFFRDWFLTMNVVLLVTAIFLIPVLYFVLIFVCSINPKWRKKLDKYVGFGELPTRERLDNLETKLSNIETTLKDIKDKLDKHMVGEINNEPKLIKKELGGTLNMSASLKAEAKDGKKTTKAIRESDTNSNYSVDFEGQTFSEKYEGKTSKSKRDKRKKDINIVRRFLPRFNQCHGKNYTLDEYNQPSESDSVDIVIKDKTYEEQGLQVTESDAKPWYEIAKGLFTRVGDTYKINSEAIKNAITKKKDKNYGDQHNLILILNGWKAVRKEELSKFMGLERGFLNNVGFKEIWFV